MTTIYSRPTGRKLPKFSFILRKVGGNGDVPEVANDCLRHFFDNGCHCRQALPSHLCNGKMVIASAEAIQTQCKSTFRGNGTLYYRLPLQNKLKCSLRYAKCSFEPLICVRIADEFKPPGRVSFKSSA